jgi:transposase
MESYSKEFRRDVLAARDAGETTHQVAMRFEVSKAWVRRIVQQRRETGQVAPKTTRHRTPGWQAGAAWLLAKVTARPDIYLRELKADLKLELGHKVSLQTICNACRGLGQSRKKRRSSRPSKTAPMSPSAATSGTRRSRKSTQTASSSSTKPGRKRT